MNQPHQTRSILVVEDDESIRDALETCLRRAGHTVVGTSRNGDVLALLKSQRFDLVITDVLMPDADATEGATEAAAVSRPCATEPSIPPMSIGWSCPASDFLWDIATTGGTDRPLMRPIHLDELLVAGADR